MWRRSEATTLLLAPLVAWVLAAGSPAASAGGVEEEGLSLQFTPYRQSIYRQEAEAIFRANWDLNDPDKLELKVAYFDVNDDGRDELFLFSETGWFCGNSGCSIGIYQEQDGKWSNIGSVSGFGVDIGPRSRMKLGYRSLGGYLYYYEWNGKKYRGHCFEPNDPIKCPQG